MYSRASRFQQAELVRGVAFGSSAPPKKKKPDWDFDPVYVAKLKAAHEEFDAHLAEILAEARAWKAEHPEEP